MNRTYMENTTTNPFQVFQVLDVYGLKNGVAIYPPNWYCVSVSVL